MSRRLLDEHDNLETWSFNCITRAESQEEKDRYKKRERKSEDLMGINVWEES
jgi:hypothetical protein